MGYINENIQKDKRKMQIISECIGHLPIEGFETGD